MTDPNSQRYSEEDVDAELTHLANIAVALNTPGLQLLTRESDRGAVLLGLSQLEELLKCRISQQSEKPLRNAAHVIDQAHSLGIVSARTRSMLHELRELRNECAHEMKVIDLGAGDAADRLEILWAWKNRVEADRYSPVPGGAVSDAFMRDFTSWREWISQGPHRMRLVGVVHIMAAFLQALSVFGIREASDSA